tara:strand:- start:2060 stop:2392 length:333 start_codon:yes stop_codon:yes gene_type:complete
MINPSEQHWFSLVDDYEKSGLSQRQYCQDNDLPFGKFRYYLTKFREKTPKTIPFNDSTPANFETVTIQYTRTEEKQSLAVTINLPNKIICDIKLPSSLLGVFLKEMVAIC